ncbi:putative polysaccharide biosynthesis protein [Tetragenococcus halophilus subsp. halophilus]|uniref:Putative polysaccharide biosynthesis protein n=1 Tax=Tetragenococcus halophilus subsp. halophilus TaxID=1513897 RepID=A0A2H6CV21_TETHA|nr:acyltransferase family protein [Tetragenococcus halophilus]GBD68839.1 putative polysaccharide biosynthesis protein [Tetragenococcus halophilus subsp. halophilus]
MKSTKNIHQYVFVILIIITIISQILLNYTFRSSVDDNQIKTLFWVRHLFSFGIPGVLILWQVQDTILHSKEKAKDYLWGRIRYIFIPYLIFGLIYSMYESQVNEESIYDSFLNIVIQGNWHGAFILVILQFTILNLLLRKRFRYYKTLVIISLVVSVVYLSNQQIFQYPFFNNSTNILGWLFFYFLGTYVGYHYHTLKKLIKNNKPIIVFVTIFAFFLFTYFNEGYGAEVNLLEPALLPYFACCFFLIYSLAMSLVGLKQDLTKRIASYGSFILLFFPIIAPYLFSFFGFLEEQTALLFIFGLLFILGMSLGVAEILNQYTLTRFLLAKAFFTDDTK